MRLRPRFAGLLPLLTASTVAAGDWQDHASLPMPIANNAVTTHVLDDTLFVYTFMGIDSTKVWSGISLMAARLNTVTNVWQTLPDTPSPPGEIAASAVTVDDVIYVIGGYRVSSTGSETTSQRVFRFDPVGSSWLPRAADLPVRTDDAVAGVWADSLIYVMSGWSFNHNVQDVQIYDPPSDTWAAATPLPDFGTFGGVGGVCGDQLVFMDGVADTGQFSFDLVNRVVVGTINPNDPTDVTWEDRGPHPGAPVYRAAGWNLPDADARLVISGGTDNPYNFDGIGYDGNPSEPLGQLWSYHPASDTYVFHDDKPVPTMDHRGFPFGGGRMWIVGGMEAGQVVTDRVSSWDPDVVTAVPALASPGLPVLRAGPNPARTNVRFFAPTPSELVGARIHDVSGRAVRSFGEPLDLGAGFRWDLRDGAGRRVGAGVYWLHGQVEGRPVARSVTVLDPR
jgi:N-acetylneuraminic acid mutarotase